MENKPKNVGALITRIKRQFAKTIRLPSCGEPWGVKHSGSHTVATTSGYSVEIYRKRHQGFLIL